jgi:cytosine/adenosine deaminase-related metal-dependent hydrolase
VLARGDGEREAVEDAAVALDDGRISELEDWIRQSGKV